MKNYSIDCLVTTYNYCDEQIIDMLNSMNLFTHTIVRNQNGTISHKQININGNMVDIYCANDIGLSKNRNELLKLSTADFIIFSDDDEIFDRKLFDKMQDFLKKNNAECFIFNIQGINIGRGKIKTIKEGTFRKCRWKDISSTGVWRLLIKRDIAAKHSFDERIGSGTKFLCGEDTLFLYEIFKEHNMILVGQNLASIIEKESLWYSKRFCDEYLFVKGYIYKILYPRLFKLYIIRFLFKEKKLCFSNYKKCLYGISILSK